MRTIGIIGSAVLSAAFILAFDSVCPAQPVGAQRRPAAVEFTSSNVEKAIEKGCAWLMEQQQADGSWPAYITAGQKFVMKVGTTSMAIYALIASGVPANDPKVQKALDWLVANDVPPTDKDPSFTYDKAFACLAYFAANKQLKDKYIRQLEADVETLYLSHNAGKYHYLVTDKAPRHPAYDNSNSQYGLYGVWTGARAGLEIPKEYWEKCLKHWLADQMQDGGWCYGVGESDPAKSQSKGSMTVAGIASLFVCIDWLYMDKFVKCQAGADFAPVKKGLDWMEKKFEGSVKNGGNIQYYLYGVERVGLASGYKYFGTSDWYKTGATYLLETQTADGSWRYGGTWNSPDSKMHANFDSTGYALLFLARGRLPVLINRLEYDGDWSNRPRALANFCRWSEKAFETESNWQIITLKSDVNEWHDAPVLTITGSKEPKFSEEDIQKLRTFVWQGGTLLSITECNGAPFGKGIRELYKKLFPKYELTQCGKDHPLNTLLYKSGGTARFSEVHNGIRPLAIHTDVDLPLSWQQYQVATGKPSFEAAANVVMYVTDKQFKFRGSKVWPGEPASPPGKSLKIARLRYAGNYDPEPLALQRLSRLMSANYGINVDWQRAASAPASGPASAVPPTGVQPRDLAADVKLAVMTGTGGFNLEQADKDALKKWVDAGGILFLDAAGTKGFADSARDLIGELWGADSLVILPLENPLYQLKDMKIEKVKYRRATRARLGGMKEPRLMAVLSGDRPKVFFSQEDLNGGLVGYSSYNCDGYESDSAVDMMRNIIIYTVSAPAIPASPASQTAQPISARQGQKTNNTFVSEIASITGKTP